MSVLLEQSASKFDFQDVDSLKLATNDMGLTHKQAYSSAVSSTLMSFDINFSNFNVQSLIPYCLSILYL